jgi:mono/diheme cytochrome c family protein
MRLAAATAIVIALTAATGCGGESATHHSQYLYMQKCASCHGVSADATTPVPNAQNLLDPANRPQLEQVRARSSTAGRAPKAWRVGRQVSPLHRGEKK